MHPYPMQDASRPQPIDRIAYFGRVSTPKQKLEHQRESVLRFAEANSLHIPPELWFEDKVRRHKLLTEGENFARMMALAKDEKLDWIVIATFDRWGISDKDDIFVLRKQLKNYDVQLWSVADELNITGTDDASFWRVAARAEGATSYVTQQAQKNIQKMILMAQQGLSGSGNAPYGVDLVCYPLKTANVPDLDRPMFRVVRERYIRPALYRVLYYGKDGQVEREEVTERMPLRDKKTTGYRYERSQDEHRISAVNLIFESYDNGMKSFGDISEHLWKLGFKHYDKPFGTHGVESILRNPIYTGLPAWGKVGVGTYLVSQDGQGVKPKRKAKDPYVIKKPKDQYIQPPDPLWEPIVPLDLWERVQARLDDRPKNDPMVGMRRQRSTVLHPLNGKVYCPDCGNPMVLGATHSHGYVKRYFLCGLYRRTIRKQCRANSVPWAKLDAAMDELLALVKDRIDGLTSPSAASLLREEWVKQTELGRILGQICSGAFHGATADVEFITECVRQSGVRSKPKDRIVARVDDDKKTIEFESFDDILQLATIFYNTAHEKSSGPLREELADIERRQKNITTALEEGLPQASRAEMYGRLNSLAARKREVEDLLIPLTVKADALIDQMKLIRETIERSDAAGRAALIDTFVDRVIPRFEGEPIKGHPRPFVLEVIPRASNHVMPQPMKLGSIRTGTGSSPPPARTRPGTSSPGAPG